MTLTEQATALGKLWKSSKHHAYSDGAGRHITFKQAERIAARCGTNLMSVERDSLYRGEYKLWISRCSTDTAYLVYRDCAPFPKSWQI